MSNCPLCNTSITFTNKPTFKSGVLANGETICQPCKMKTINYGVKGKLNQYSPEELKDIFNVKEQQNDLNDNKKIENIKRIENQIAQSATPNATNFFGRKEVNELPNIIQENEIIKSLIQGTYNNGSGILVLTDKRMIFVDKGVLSLKTEDFPLSKITSIQFESGLLLAKIKIHTSSNVAEIANVEKDAGKLFVDFARNQIEEHESKGSNSQPIQQQPDILGQIEKLAELKDKGILTEAEFNEKKTKLLEQL